MYTVHWHTCLCHTNRSLLLDAMLRLAANVAHTVTEERRKVLVPWKQQLHRIKRQTQLQSSMQELKFTQAGSVRNDVFVFSSPGYDHWRHKYCSSSWLQCVSRTHLQRWPNRSATRYVMLFDNSAETIFWHNNFFIIMYYFYMHSNGKICLVLKKA